MTITALHKRALRSGERPVAKKANLHAQVEAVQYAYITMSTTHVLHEYANDAIEDITMQHKAYRTQADAENALKQMANDRYSACGWVLSRDRNGQMSLEFEDDDGGAEESVSFEVKMIELMSARWMEKVKSKRPYSSDDVEDDATRRMTKKTKERKEWVTSRGLKTRRRPVRKTARITTIMASTTTKRSRMWKWVPLRSSIVFSCRDPKGLTQRCGHVAGAAVYR